MGARVGGRRQYGETSGESEVEENRDNLQCAAPNEDTVPASACDNGVKFDSGILTIDFTPDINSSDVQVRADAIRKTLEATSEPLARVLAMPFEKSREPEKFSAFELSGWDANIGGYESAFGTVARHSVGVMLDSAKVMRGTQLLDVCCGPGGLSAGAFERGASVIGLDFSATAIELARKTVPGGRFEQGDAQALPYPAQSFDAALCGYGLVHLPEPSLALREILRVLRPGGRAAVSVWDATGVGFSLVYEAVRARGRTDVPLPHGPDFFQFGSSQRMQAVLAEAGFRRCSSEHIPSGLACRRR